MPEYSSPLVKTLYKKARVAGSALALLLLMSGCTGVVQPQPPSQVQVCPPMVCPVCQPVECPAPKVIEKPSEVKPPVSQPLPKTAGKLNLPIVGGVENVYVNPPGLLFEARIDTGAESSSIHAENIQLVERDSKKYVLFSLRNPETNELVELERRLERTVLIKQKASESERRYVVKLWLTLGEIKEIVDVTLSNRADFSYSLLVGRNLLTDTAIVDVSRRHTITVKEK